MSTWEPLFLLCWFVGMSAIGWVSVNKSWNFIVKLKRLNKLKYLISTFKVWGGRMNNLPQIFGGFGLPGQGIPTLKSTDFVSRIVHSWKLEDLARISKLEGEIAQNNLVKFQATMQAMTEMATFSERIKAEIETVELKQRYNRATVKAEESKAKILENEAKKEEFDFYEYMKRVKNED